jgi:hypothetical protein
VFDLHAFLRCVADVTACLTDAFGSTTQQMSWLPVKARLHMVLDLRSSAVVDRFLNRSSFRALSFAPHTSIQSNFRPTSTILLLSETNLTSLFYCSFVALSFASLFAWSFVIVTVPKWHRNPSLRALQLRHNRNRQDPGKLPFRQSKVLLEGRARREALCWRRSRRLRRVRQ